MTRRTADWGSCPMGPKNRLAFSVALLLTATAAGPAASQDRPGEIRRVEAGADLPDCPESGAPALCIVESYFDLRILPDEDAGLLESAVDWVLSKVISEILDGPEPYEIRPTVVVPEVTEYRVASSRVFDEAALAEYRAETGNGRPYDADFLRPGMMKMVIEVRFRDRGGVTWPTEGWQTWTYYLSPSGGGWELDNIDMFNANRRFIHGGPDDSRCIGDPTTPICAVDTWLACHVLDNPELCRLVARQKSTDSAQLPTFMEGRGISFYVLQANQLDAPDGSGSPPQAYEVILQSYFEFDGSTDHPPREEYLRFELSRGETGWRIDDLDITHWDRME